MQWLFTFYMVCNIVASITLSVIAPFFPPFAKNERGIHENIVGLIFSAQPIGSTFAAYISGKLMTKRNRHLYMCAGLVFLAIGQFLFASLLLFESKGLTIALALFARFINGFGFSFYFTPLYSLIPELYPKQIESKMSFATSMNSIGYLIGPGCGSLLYGIGGFIGPFLFFGSVALLAAFILPFVAKTQSPFQKVRQDEEHGPSGNLKQQLLENEVVRARQVGYLECLKKLEIFIALELVFICHVGFQYYSPIIANFFQEEFGIPSEDIGYYLLATTGSYSMVGIVISYYPVPKVDKPKMFFGGLLVASLSAFFYGPEPLLGLKPAMYFTLSAQSVFGASIIFPYVMLLPYLNYYIRKYFNLEKAGSNIASALFQISSSLGQLSGPLIAGFMGNSFGFERAASVYGLMLFCSTFLSLPLVKKELAKKLDGQGNTILMSVLNAQEKL